MWRGVYRIMEEKICRECTFCDGADFLPRCKHELEQKFAITDKVNGKIIANNFCTTIRIMFDRPCGIEGKLFIQKRK